MCGNVGLELRLFVERHITGIAVEPRRLHLHISAGCCGPCCSRSLVLLLLVLLVLVRMLILFGHPSLLLLSFPPLIPPTSLMLLLVSAPLKVTPWWLPISVSVVMRLSTTHSATSQVCRIGRHCDSHPLLNSRSLVIREPICLSRTWHVGRRCCNCCRLLKWLDPVHIVADWYRWRRRGCRRSRSRSGGVVHKCRKCRGGCRGGSSTHLCRGLVLGLVL